MRDLLTSQFHVLCAGPTDPARSAVQRWQDHADLELAILDLHMPASDLQIPGSERRPQSEDVGFELVAALKAIRPQSRIAVRSGYETHQNLVRAVAGGVDAFIGKGWDRDSV